MIPLIWAIRDCLARNRRIRACASLILPRHTWRAALVCVLLAALLFAAAIMIPAYADTGTPMYVCVREGSTLNARAEPVDGRVEMRLERGDEIDCVRIADGWAEVLVGGTERLYVAAEYLSSAPPEAPAQYTVTANGRVRVRKEPGGETAAWVHPGDAVTVYAWREDGAGNWARVDGGYIMADYLTMGGGKD